jgi:RNA recognition motif-containing protein
MDLNFAQERSMQAQRPRVDSTEQATRLFVGRLPLQITESQLYNYFRKFGELSRCEIPTTTQTKKKQFAFVEFVSLRDALAVLDMPQHFILGTPVKLERAMSTLEIFQKQLQASKCKLFVSGDLIAKTNSVVISKEISALGQVERVKKLKCASKTFNSCFVTMKSIADAEYLLEQKSLVFPTLKQITFKRFVPRVSKRVNSPLPEDCQQPISNLALSAIKYLPIQESFRHAQKIPAEKFYSNQRTIVIRPGLWIVSNNKQDWEDSYKPTGLTTLDNQSFVDSSSMQGENKYLRNIDLNLRFNIENLPTDVHLFQVKALC